MTTSKYETRFSSQGHYFSEDIMVLVFYMILLDHVTKRLNNFTSKSSVNVSHHPAEFVRDKHCDIGDVSKESVSLTIVAKERQKRHYLSYHSNSCKDDKKRHKTH